MKVFFFINISDFCMFVFNIVIYCLYNIGCIIGSNIDNCWIIDVMIDNYEGKFFFF